MTSYFLRPAVSAGEPLTVSVTTTPSVWSDLSLRISVLDRLVMLAKSFWLIPMNGRVTLPSFSSWAMTRWTSLDGIAKPIPSTSTFENLLELIPTRSPSLLSKAPPELPGLIAAEVWMSVVSISAWPSLSRSIGTIRDWPEIIPCVTELENLLPRGEPMAMAMLPTLVASESANLMADLTFLDEILTTAKSDTASRPTNSPSSVVPSANLTLRESAFSTTWLLVTK